MADEHNHSRHRFVLQEQDGALTHVVEHPMHRVSVTPSAWADPTPDQELEIYVFSSRSDHVFTFELSGEISPFDDREFLLRFLAGSGFSAAACNDAVDLIFALYETTEDEIMRAHVTIETYHNDHNAPVVLGLPASRDSILESLEKVTVGPGSVIMETTCAVCLDELLTKPDQVMKLLCSHVFHGDCIARWLQARSVCPMCRFDLRSVAGRHGSDS